ncbi:MAG: hypothetical protein F6K63_02790 [Moorea sp. SIO1G6]|uniref:hypothetical protein n=1 Tax=Moorena sp. SIO1G6 TaxID=2607840 RepID=UPI0013C25031|nr:hypothetical protein [Moorena sp. SIO1G6]NET63380.1 hypothetical protein [Moorena sp. SIO1G6]
MNPSSSETKPAPVEQEINLDASELLGTWKNTNSQTKNITKAIIEFDEGQLTIHIFSAGSPELDDWGKAKLQAFTSDQSSPVVGGFITQYSRGFVETSIAANCKRGVLVLQVYNSYKDSNGKFNDFSREFFHK